LPTEEQLASRKELDDFISRVAKRTRKWGQQIKSEWFGRPDKELEGYIQLGAAIKEIEDTRGYRLIMTQTAKEIEWARTQLELGTQNDADMRGYLKALRFLKEFILTVERNADISASVLSERPNTIGRDMFVKNARVEGN
jgi:hypothetical protein